MAPRASPDPRALPLPPPKKKHKLTNQSKLSNFDSQRTNPTTEARHAASYKLHSYTLLPTANTQLHSYKAEAEDARFVRNECETPLCLFLHAVNGPVVGSNHLHGENSIQVTTA